MNTPLLSIVIANYNYGRFLEEAIRSVLSQSCQDFELIICDGGSTDNSVEVIKKYAGDLPPGQERGVGELKGEVEVEGEGELKNKVEGEGEGELKNKVEGEGEGELKNKVEGEERNTPFFNFNSELQLRSPNFNSELQLPNGSSKITYWCSEPDKGQSDAFNKGFAHAHGKYLTWLNADDVMPQGAIAAIVTQLKKHPDCEWFTGNFFRFTPDGKVIECPWGPHYLPKWLQTKHQPVAVYGPATIFTKVLFNRVGGMKLEQNFMMDTDLWMRFIVAGVKQRRINAFLWAFRMHEMSKTAEFGEHKLSSDQREKFEAERRRSVAETGYQASAINRRLIQFWRLLDGSALKGLWLKANFKEWRG